MVREPIRVRLMFNSTMIRPRIGIAVIDIAVAMKSAKLTQLPPKPSAACMPFPSTKPRVNGRRMPASETDIAVRRFSVRCPKSNSSPIRNISKTRPIWLMIAKICPTDGSKTR